MSGKSAFRLEAADPKPMTRTSLEAAAATHGVTVSPSISDRAIQEAVATKLMPNTYHFVGKGEAYATRACDLALENANKAAEVAKAPAPAVTEVSAPPQVTNGTGQPHKEAAPKLLSAGKARDTMIRITMQ